ncbi:MAG TPA: asparagine synthase (glutamine-hydrolyzing) [Thermodesulfobacteriota bacterium]
MCGIVGFCSINKCTDESILRSMRDTLAHRGPDDSGLYIDQEHNVGLAHTRLSILDLSSLGHQPMSNDNGSVWITYNGEVYNFKEIREELEKKRYAFKSNTDTEVLVKAYEEWGIDCVHKFIGMFAFAIWDRNQQKLYLVRDRVGVKPLYYFFKDGILLFASELKALIKHPNFRKEINLSILPHYLRFGFIQSPYTIFHDTFKLKPGHYLCLYKNKLVEKKYWDIVDFYNADPIEGTEEEITLELENLLVNSFKYRLISDVPVGVFLSGGLDSSIVTALLQHNIGSKLKTFTIGFDESGLNEADWSKSIASYLGTDHTEYYLSVEEAANIIYKIPEIYDEPLGDHSVIPTYLVSQLARKDVTVALSADGGDELFCGYSRYKAYVRLYEKFLRLPKFLTNSVIKSMTSLNPSRVDDFYRTFQAVMPEVKEIKDKYIKWRDMLIESNNGNLIEMYKCNLSKWTTEELGGIIDYKYNYSYDAAYVDTIESMPNNELLNKVMALDFKTYLPDDILTKVDRATMSVSLEGREPFLDHRLLEFVARVPLKFKYHEGTSKYILRKVLYKHIPRELIERPKQGFVAPLSRWLKGELHQVVKEYLNEDRLRREGIFNSEVVSSYIKDFYSGVSINVNKIWFLLVFQMWKEKWT